MPGFRGIKMVSFDKKQEQMIVRAAQVSEDSNCSTWPEPAVSILIDIMAGFYAYIVNEELQTQKEVYYQKAFDAFAFHLMRLEKERLLPVDFLGKLTKDKMLAKWQEIENTYKEVTASLTPGGPPGQHLWPYFDRMTFILQNRSIRAPEAQSPKNTLPKEQAPQRQVPPNTSATTRSNASTVQTQDTKITQAHNNDNESKRQQMIMNAIEKSVPRVLEEIRAQQSQIQYEHASFAEQSEHEFRKELLALMRRRVELMEEKKAKEDADRVERTALIGRLTDVLEKLNEKLVDRKAD